MVSQNKYGILLFTIFYEEKYILPRIENENKRLQSATAVPRGTPSHLEWGCLYQAMFSDP